MKRAAAAALAILAFVLAACGTQPAATAPPVNIPPAASASAAASAPATPAAGQKSPRGNFVKRLGETAAFGPTQDNLVVSFAIDKITVGAKCTAQFVQKPEHGTFLKVDVRAETKPTMPADSFYSINPYDFSTVGADGITESSLETGPAATCLNPAEQMPPQFSPGSKYRGSIVLDSKNTAGVLVLKPGFMAATGGWEWNYG